MKRGLKREPQQLIAGEPRQRRNTCPDEEGTETVVVHHFIARDTGRNTCPDEEGTETVGLRHAPAIAVNVETHAPMKRGLKQSDSDTLQLSP